MSDSSPESYLGTLDDSVRMLSTPHSADSGNLVAQNGQLFSTLRVSGGAVALSVLEEISGRLRLLGVLQEHITEGERGSTVLEASFRRAGYWRRWASAQASLSFTDANHFTAALEVWAGRGRRVTREVRGDGLVVPRPQG